MNIKYTYKLYTNIRGKKKQWMIGEKKFISNNNDIDNKNNNTK